MYLGDSFSSLGAFTFKSDIAFRKFQHATFADHFKYQTCTADAAAAGKCTEGDWPANNEISAYLGTSIGSETDYSAKHPADLYVRIHTGYCSGHRHVVYILHGLSSTGLDAKNAFCPSPNNCITDEPTHMHLMFVFPTSGMVD